MDLGVLEVVLIVTWPTMRIHSALVDFLVVKVLLKSEILGSPMKGAVAMVDHALLSVVAAVGVLIMEKLEMGNLLVGLLNVVVELDEGKYVAPVSLP